MEEHLGTKNNYDIHMIHGTACECKHANHCMIFFIVHALTPTQAHIYTFTYLGARAHTRTLHTPTCIHT